MNKIQIKESFKRKILEAMQHPYIWPEIEQVLVQEQSLSAKYVNGKLQKKNFDKGLEKIHKAVPSIIAKSIFELEAIMDIMKVSEEIKASTLADMDIKYERAVSKGYTSRFSVWIYRTVQGKLFMYCATQIKV